MKICSFHKFNGMVRRKRLILQSIDIVKYYSTCVPEIKEKSTPSYMPVMVKQVLQHLKPKEDQIIIDMTFGTGGHSQAILEKCKYCKVIALDRDPIAYSHAKQLAERYPGRLLPYLGKFSELPLFMKTMNLYQNSVDGILFDLGCSSIQYESAHRGFSTKANGPLDMRMDFDRIPKQPSAMDVLAKATEVDLARLFKVYGKEKQNKMIAKAIVESRYMLRELKTTYELRNLVQTVLNGTRANLVGTPSHAVSSKVFQALRIFVNNELNEINFGMLLSLHYLKMGGCLVTIAYNELEDTIVKRHIVGNIVNDVANPLPLKFVSHALVHETDILDTMLDKSWQQINKHVLLPSLEELEENQWSRNARMRIAIKVK